jgi:signal transduction histidine kinase/HPt (histidine-containing phosphotransfer) domain-containing protein
MEWPVLRRGQAVIAVTALAIIGMVWLASIAALNASRRSVLATATANVNSTTLLLSAGLSERLSAIDRTLRVLEHDWEESAAGIDLSDWRTRAPGLGDLPLELSITDASGTVRQATAEPMLGRSIAGLPSFRELAALPRDDGELGLSPASNASVLIMSRRLDYPDGRFAGTITASYDMAPLVRFYRETDLGRQGLVDVVDDRTGRVTAADGGGAVPGTDLGASVMLQALRDAPNGRWIGPSAPDRIVRIHALHRLAAYDLDVVMAMSMASALEPAQVWRWEELAFACLTTVLVLALAGGLILNVRSNRQRLAALARDRFTLAAAKADADAKSQRLEVTLAGMTDGVMMIDADLRLMAWNARVAEMIGLPPTFLEHGLAMEAILRKQAEAGEFGDVDCANEVARRIAAINGTRDTVTGERTRRNGRTHAVRRRRLVDGSIIAIYSDITESKRTETALRRAHVIAEASAKTKSRLVAMVSHEIRQPLNTLLNSLSLLAENDLPAAPRRLVGMAQQSGAALLGLLNDVLDMSKMESGQLSLRPTDFALRPLLQSVLDMFATQAAARGIELALTIADNAPERLHADPVRIRQIVINLVSNAVKFAMPGRVLLLAETDAFGPGSIGMLHLTVEDPGPTIDPVGRDRLFQPFVQLADGNQDAEPSGTGLGLTICRMLAGLLGGEIGYEPTATGNAFWVRLAFRVLDQDAPSIPPRRIFPRARLLLVEDMRANQLIVATMLRREGHMVDVATSGSAAIRAVERVPYDMVLMDIQMPGMTGIQAARCIRALPPPAGVVPICALTGDVSAEDRALCTDAGMDAVLGKPVELATLTGMLESLVWPFRPWRMPHGLPEPPLPAAPLPSLMPARLAELRANLEPAVLSELADQAIDEMSIRLPMLREAIAAGDADRIKAEAHALIGVAGSYAMVSLEFRLNAILEAVRSDSTERAAMMAGDVEAEFAQAAAALRQATARERTQERPVSGGS